MLNWVQNLIINYTDHIIKIDCTTCQEWAGLLAIDGTNAIDAFIASQALQMNMTLVTRNTKHFRLFGVQLLNPFVI